MINIVNYDFLQNKVVDAREIVSFLEAMIKRLNDDEDEETIKAYQDAEDFVFAHCYKNN